MKDKETIRQEIIQNLKTIFDPEIPVNVWDLGLIYKIDIREDMEVAITMTLTSPNCPVAESLPSEIKNRIEAIPEVKKVIVHITFNPPWSMKKLSDEAKLELDLLY